MIKVLIIDDEPNVRMGLKKMINWEENGFVVCGEAEDADEGFRKIMTIKPDIVLVDIKMPGKLGTDLIRETREAGFGGKFIILSGYSNFEYAKDAIKYGVKSYILKPIDEDELLEVLLKLKKEIADEKRLEGGEDIVRKANLRKIMIGDYKDDYSIEGSFTLVLISIENDKKEKFEENYIKYVEDMDVIHINEYLAMLFKDTKRERIIRLLTNIKEKIESEIKFFAVVTDEVDDINKIYYEYNKALSAIKNKFLYLEEVVITLEEMNKVKNAVLELDVFIKRLQSYVEVQDYDKVNELIDIFKDYVSVKEYPEAKIKAICIDILLKIREKMFNDYEIDRKEVSSNEIIVQDIYSKSSLFDASEYLRKEIMDMSNRVSLGSSNNNIKRIISYMEKNYYKDLKLETLAKIFNYNSAYLGKLLKNSTGENFNTKLDKIRIEKAKKLLVSNKLKVYQVCEKVGYKNIDYFHSKFKKYVGTTPLSYKKSNEKIKNNL